MLLERIARFELAPLDWKSRMLPLTPYPLGWAGWSCTTTSPLPSEGHRPMLDRGPLKPEAHDHIPRVNDGVRSHTVRFTGEGANLLHHAHHVSISVSVASSMLSPAVTVTTDNLTFCYFVLNRIYTIFIS